MPSHADEASILRSLDAVEAERVARAADPVLGRRVVALKAWQQARFRVTHAELLASSRYRDAARFFLEELYGPADFSRRDAQFARIVPALVRLFPQGIVDTVAGLADLHALSERLDSAMARALEGDVVDAAGYVAAWRRVGDVEGRERQVTLVIAAGQQLDRHTRVPLLTASLRMMRGPARAAGMGDLQSFLERGLETFRAMGGAAEFLGRIEGRERSLIARLFDPAQGAEALAADLPGPASAG
jgi:hypothetical protein